MKKTLMPLLMLLLFATTCTSQPPKTGAVTDTPETIIFTPDAYQFYENGKKVVAPVEFLTFKFKENLLGEFDLTINMGEQSITEEIPYILEIVGDDYVFSNNFVVENVEYTNTFTLTPGVSLIQYSDFLNESLTYFISSEYRE